MKIGEPSLPRTIMEVYKTLPEGTLAELVNGQIYMSPAPSTQHQRVCRKILIQLSQYVELHNLGEVFPAPVDVYLDEHSNAVQPDLVYISTSQSSLIKKNGIEGTPDLMIEVLSRGNNDHDLITKKNVYESSGIREYWIIDPDYLETIVYQLQEGTYQLTARQTARIFSPLFQQEFEI